MERSENRTETNALGRLRQGPATAQSVTQRSGLERARNKAAHVFATCAMGAWLLIAIVPFVVVLVEIG